MQDINTLQLMVKKTLSYRLASTLLLLLIFFLNLSGCSLHKSESPTVKYSLTEEERAHLKEFFRDLLFKHPGAFTLFGTKPISTCCLYSPLSEEEKEQQKAYYESLSKEQKATLRSIKYDFEDNYKRWQEIKSRFPISQYLFGVFTAPCDEKTGIVLFVNIEMTMRTFLQYYEDFRRVLGYDFDPFATVFEVEDNNSSFWNDVLKSHALQGILLGFGRDNAWFFDWERQEKMGNAEQRSFLTSLPFVFYEERDRIDYSPEHFLLPIYKSYGLHSDQSLFHEYQKEQKQIKKLYKGKDEVDIALEWLTR